MEKAVIDAQVLFYFHYRKEEIPPLLRDLKKKVIDGKVIAIIPVVAISELFWKMRKAGKLNEMKKAISRWEKSEGVIIDHFDLEILKLMLNNEESHELHDEIIAMSCRRHNTRIIYSTDEKYEKVFHLELRSWK